MEIARSVISPLCHVALPCVKYGRQMSDAPQRGTGSQSHSTYQSILCDSKCYNQRPYLIGARPCRKGRKRGLLSYEFLLLSVVVRLVERHVLF
jgi:hypothetical protein